MTSLRWPRPRNRQCRRHGYSLGAGVALHTAIRHATWPEDWCLVSTAFKRDGWYPEILAGMAQVGAGAAEAMKQTPMYQMYSRIAPKPADWPRAAQQNRRLAQEELRLVKRRSFDQNSHDARRRDADAIPPTACCTIFRTPRRRQKGRRLDGSGISTARLAILPGLTHYNIFPRRCWRHLSDHFLIHSSDQQNRDAQLDDRLPSGALPQKNKGETP